MSSPLRLLVLSFIRGAPQRGHVGLRVYRIPDGLSLTSTRSSLWDKNSLEIVCRGGERELQEPMGCGTWKGTSLVVEVNSSPVPHLTCPSPCGQRPGMRGDTAGSPPPTRPWPSQLGKGSAIQGSPAEICTFLSPRCCAWTRLSPAGPRTERELGGAGVGDAVTGRQPEAQEEADLWAKASAAQ